MYRFIECKECGRAVHRICVLYLEHLWPSGFMCDNCRARNGVKRSDSKFVAKRKLANCHVLITVIMPFILFSVNILLAVIYCCSA